MDMILLHLLTAKYDKKYYVVANFTLLLDSPKQE